MIQAILSSFLVSATAFGLFTMLLGFYMTRHLVYKPLLPTQSMWFTQACVLDRILLGSIYILEAIRTQLSFVREFTVGFNKLSIINPEPDATRNTLSTNLLGHALKFMNTASRVSTRVQGNIAREVGTEIYNTFVNPRPAATATTTPPSQAALASTPASSLSLSTSAALKTAAILASSSISTTTAPWEGGDDEDRVDSVDSFLDSVGDRIPDPVMND
jgi:hypothetical protein